MTIPTDEELQQRLTERGEATNDVVRAIMKDNPLAGKSEEEMVAINREMAGFQDALRSAMTTGMVFGVNPAGAFNVAITALIGAMASVEQTDKTRHALGYLLLLSRALKSLDDGPMALLNGELLVEGVVDVRKDVPKEVRERFGLGDGPVQGGTHIVRKGNVIDASARFAKGKTTTVH